MSLIGFDYRLPITNSQADIIKLTVALLSQLVATEAFDNICLVATDLDGTLTQNSKFAVNLLQAFVDLAAINIEVLIVTGRSAGWVSGLATYLPVAGAIAENSNLFYQSECDAVTLTPISDIASHRTKLAQSFQQL